MTTSTGPFAGRQRVEPQRQVRSAEEYLDGGASVAAKWPKVGAKVVGDVIGWSPTEVQMTDKDTGEPQYWEGKKRVIESKLRFPETSKQNPCMQITVDLQCEPTGYTWESNRYIRRELPDDDGVRTAYIHGELAKAFRKGRQAAAQKYNLGRQFAPLEVGAHVAITRGEDVKKPNDYYAYTYEVVWTPAAHNPAYQDKMVDSAAGPDDDSPWEGGDDSEPPF
jgi:hypothetical protein